MSQAYRPFFGFSREPFSSELKVEEILKTEAVLAVADRVDYAIRLGAIALITGAFTDSVISHAVPSLVDDLLDAGFYLVISFWRKITFKNTFLDAIAVILQKPHQLKT